ncbi:hypothetical protein Tco_0129946, partial [Tanacetum coccineum]
MGSIDLSSVRSCWGNSNFDYVHSYSVGNSGGILCIWDPNSFRRSSFTRSDYFVIVRGVWLKSGIDLMRVVVNAPQKAKEKRMYDYGPIPFRFYRYWLKVDGFDKLVRDSWNVAPVNKKNAIRNFMGKLKFLKDRIRSWLSIYRSNSR